MNHLGLPFNLPDLQMIGTLTGLLIWSISAALVLLVVEITCFLCLTVRRPRSPHRSKALTEKY